MAFGKSKEQKQFEKEQKKQEKEQALLKKFGVDELSDPRDVQSVREIAVQMSGKGLMEFGAALGGASEKDYLSMANDYQKILIQQNFIIIRQLDRISKALEDKDLPTLPR